MSLSVVTHRKCDAFEVALASTSCLTRHRGHREQLERAHVDRAPSLSAGRLVEYIEEGLGDKVVRDACDEVGREPQGLLVHPRPVPVRKWRSTQQPQKGIKGSVTLVG